MFISKKGVKNCIQEQFQILNINVHKFNLVNIGLIIIASIISSVALLTNNYQTVIASKIIGLAIIPFISLCIMLLAGNLGNILNSSKSCLLFIITCLSISSLIGFLNEYTKWKTEPSHEMMIRAEFKYENIWLELFISFVAGIGIYLSILKTSTIALLGFILVISIVPAMCNAGLFWGMHLHNFILSDNDKINNESNKKLYLDYGKRSFVIFLSNIIGMFLGFMVSFIVYCVL
jgi:hypothetical protein